MLIVDFSKKWGGIGIKKLSHIICVRLGFMAVFRIDIDSESFLKGIRDIRIEEHRRRKTAENKRKYKSEKTF